MSTLNQNISRPAGDHQPINTPAADDIRRGCSGSARLFTLANPVFVFSAIVSYIILGLAHVNLPRYYPGLRQISIEPIKDAVAMGFYGRFFTALIMALILTGLFLIFYPLLKKLDLTRAGLINKLMIGAFWFGAAVIVVEEWHEWGIEKRALDTTNFFNSELGLFLLALLIFFGGVVLTALGFARIKRIIADDTD